MSDNITVVNLSAVDLNLLVVLDAVLAERSVARAAARLHVTPPAVSNALARLRVLLGEPVVARSGRGIVPTPRALALAPELARALSAIDHLLHGSAFDAARARPTLTLALADAGQIARLPGLATRLASAMPCARLRVVNVDTMLALGGLAGTEVDVAIGVADPAPGIRRQVLYAEQTVVVARRGHPRIGARVGAKLLAAERWVDVQVALGKGSRSLSRALAKLGIERDLAATAPSFVAALAMVGATDWITAIPRSVVAGVGASFDVRVVETPLAPEPTPMFLSWHERTHADPARVLLRELVVASASAGAASKVAGAGRARRDRARA